MGWLNTRITYFAPEPAIWGGLSGDSLSLPHAASAEGGPTRAERFTFKMVPSHDPPVGVGCGLGAQPGLWTAWGSWFGSVQASLLLLGFPHSTAAGFYHSHKPSQIQGKRTQLTSPWEKGHHHIINRACGMGDIVATIFGKYNQPTTVTITNVYCTLTLHQACHVHGVPSP